MTITAEVARRAVALGPRQLLYPSLLHAHWRALSGSLTASASPLIVRQVCVQRARPLCTNIRSVHCPCATWLLHAGTQPPLPPLNMQTDWPCCHAATCRVFPTCSHRPADAHHDTHRAQPQSHAQALAASYFTGHHHGTPHSHEAIQSHAQAVAEDVLWGWAYCHAM